MTIPQFNKDKELLYISFRNLFLQNSANQIKVDLKINKIIT